MDGWNGGSTDSARRGAGGEGGEREVGGNTGHWLCVPAGHYLFFSSPVSSSSSSSSISGVLGSLVRLGGLASVKGS